MRRIKLAVFGVVLALLWIVVPLAAAQTSPAPRLASAPQQTAPTQVAPTGLAGTPGVDVSSATGADEAETPGELLTAFIVFTVVGIVVAVTLFLVWHTRPSRRQARETVSRQDK